MVFHYIRIFLDENKVISSRPKPQKPAVALTPVVLEVQLRQRDSFLLVPVRGFSRTTMGGTTKKLHSVCCFVFVEFLKKEDGKNTSRCKRTRTTSRRASAYFPRAKHSSLTVEPLATWTNSGNWTSILGSYSPITPEEEEVTSSAQPFQFQCNTIGKGGL